MDKFDTVLTPQEEKQFQVWKVLYAPRDSGMDYDLRGAFKAGFKPDPKTRHWPDTFKKPNHPTFSDQSIYASRAPEMAGTWTPRTGPYYTPPIANHRPTVPGLDTVQSSNPIELLRQILGGGR